MKDLGRGNDCVYVKKTQSIPVSEKVGYKSTWRIRKFADDESHKQDKPYEVSVIAGNLLLNEGIAELWDLAIAAGSPTNYNNANARLGVGESATAENATQTGLLGATTLYKAMDATYPIRTAQTVRWRSTFGSTEANWAWNEFSVDNGATPLKNLNRKVSAQGTKTSGQTWELSLDITLT